MSLLHNLGSSRSAHAPGHLLQTPETFVRAGFPGLKKGAAIVHISPAGGAAFTQYTVEFDAGGSLSPSERQRFVYVLDGSVSIGGVTLPSSGYFYASTNESAALTALEPSRVAIIEKCFVPTRGLDLPVPFHGNERDLSGHPLSGDDGIFVRPLFPESSVYDFAVNTMTYQPGASLSAVEIHVMEHGLLMLEGGGIYRLGDRWYPVAAGDFIWMASYCPQWFAAIGKTPAKYLIYKDWNRLS